MNCATIQMTLYYTDDEVKKTAKIFLKNGDEKKQVEEFIIGLINVFKYSNIDFCNLIVNSVVIEYVKKEILDISQLDI